MRILKVLASLVVVGGCASSKPQSEPATPVPASAETASAAEAARATPAKTTRSSMKKRSASGTQKPGAPQMPTRRGRHTRLGFLIGPAFVVLGLWFLFGPDGLEIPPRLALDESSLVPADELSTAPRRQVLDDPPVVHLAGFERTCMDCHRTFPAREDPPRELLQHRHIILNHGINDRCGECHWDVDRNRLIQQDGTVVGFAQVNELCGACHGSVYRDWQRAAHGRTNGYWDASRGVVKRLKCTECHDPHRPRVGAMDSLKPLPGPNTLRAGRPARQHHASPTGGRRDADSEQALEGGARMAPFRPHDS